MGNDLDRTNRDHDPPAPTPTLLLVAGEGKLSTHPIAGPQIVIGRAPDCDVPVRHASLSRRHAVVRIGPPLTVQDLGSTNGTRVSREVRVGGDPVPLQLGESFHIGPFSLVVLGGHAAEVSRGGVRDVIRIDDPTPDGVPAVVRDIAASRVSVLVLGETGVGKEVLASTIHRLSRRTGTYARINCAALAESLLESELFGHEKGAFTGAAKAKPGLLESATAGTALLDEIGELAPPLQAKLLRALESGEVTRVGAVQPTPIDVRFVAATNRELADHVAAGRFRPDLYYRLDGVSLVIPPLRERRGQIVPLALQFIAAVGGGAASAAFLARLEAHDWPGNVRELKATVERAVLIAAGSDLTPAHLILSKRVSSPEVSAAAAAASATAVTPKPESYERARIVAALDACAGNQTRAAKQLGISRATLTTKLAVHKIRRPRS
jgi:two-component system, NtrC family, response regulator AtoC